MIGKLAANPYYVEYEERLKELSRLMAEGKGDTPEADALREAMEHPERQLTREEIERLNGLSADLYMLEGDEIYEPFQPGEDTEARAPERLRVRLQKAWERGDAASTLALLRQGAAGLSEDQRAYVRARAYEDLGHLDTALLFMRYAAEQAPQDSAYKFRILDLLDRLGRQDEKVALATLLVEQEGSSPELLLQSAGVLFGSTRGLTQEQARPICEAVIRAVQSALHRLKDASGPLVPFFRAYGQLTLGLCYKMLGRPEEALAAFNKAVEFDKTDAAALVARGMLLAESDPKAALSDFEKAVANNTPLIAPYLELAHHALVHRDYARCLEMCSMALARTQDPRIQAVVWQWAALAIFEAEGLTMDVRHAFASAMTLDPLNLQIRHNFELVQQRAQAASADPHLPAAWQLSSPHDLSGVEQLLPQLPAAA